LKWATKILDAIEQGKGKQGDLEKLAYLSKFWSPGHTFCALAPGAAEPVQSALKFFREDFERHINEHRCPWRG
jgi:NADH-quinone oxidoreductase subunit F